LTTGGEYDTYYNAFIAEVWVSKTLPFQQRVTIEIAWVPILTFPIRSPSRILFPGSTPGQTIFSEFAMLDFPHNQSSNTQKYEGNRFRAAHQERGHPYLAKMLLRIPETLRPTVADKKETAEQNNNYADEGEQSQPTRRLFGPKNIELQFDGGSLECGWKDRVDMSVYSTAFGGFPSVIGSPNIREGLVT
jgi:hypothetical protein